METGHHNCRLTGQVNCRLTKKFNGDYLVLDVSYIGAMVVSELVDDYISKYGNPNDEFSFNEVFIIGPTVKSSIRLGNAAL